MTTTVLPWSTSLFSTSSSFFTSSKCRPVVARRGCRACGRVAALRQLLGQLDALGLAAAERGGRLAELDVAQPTSCSVRSLLATGGSARRAQRLVHREFEHLGDRPPAVLDVERLAIVAAALALLARDYTSGRKCISIAITPSPGRFRTARPSR